MFLLLFQIAVANVCKIHLTTTHHNQLSLRLNCLYKNVKFWEALGWICLVGFFVTGAIYFFWDDSYTESPNWLIAAIGCWFYRDHLLKGSTGK